MAVGGAGAQAQHGGAAESAEEAKQTIDYSKRTPDPAALDKAQARATRDEEARVIVTLRTRFTPEGELSTDRLATQRRLIREQQTEAETLVGGDDVIRRFATVPLLAVTATAEEIEALGASDAVADVRLDRLIAPALASTTPIVGSTRVNGRWITGHGQTVAVVDTGVASGHPFLAGRVVDEACFADVAWPGDGECPGGRAGPASMSGPGAGVPCRASRCDHGTHVAGIAAGAQGANNFGFDGVAPVANIMSVNVFHTEDNVWPLKPCGDDPTPCPKAWTSDVIKGLEYVYSRRSDFNIAAVNMSLVNHGDHTSPCAGSWYRPVIDNLRSASPQSRRLATVVMPTA